MIHRITAVYLLPLLLLFSLPGFSQDSTKAVSLTINGGSRMQRMAGIGVNVNTRAWKGDELKPALNFLQDSMHAQVWRVIVETVEKWEDTNDNADPFSFNWKYYDKLYETPKFRKAWDMMAYLNSRGITDNLMINFMGAVPKWMGEEKVLPQFEDEYIEMLASFFYYARVKKHLKFGLISLMNEPDIRKEGPTVNSTQYVKLLEKLVTRLDKLGLKDVRHVGPDVAGMGAGISDYVPMMMKNKTVMDKVAHIGLHSYGGYYANVDSALSNSAYPKLGYWITEWNNWCKGCDDGILGEYTLAFGSKSVQYLMELVGHGAAACLVWEGYDSYYEHHAPSLFSFWGMLAYDSVAGKYTPRPHYYPIAQVSRFIKPGSWLVSSKLTGEGLTILSFADSLSNLVSVVGINEASHPVKLNATLDQLKTGTQLGMTHTDPLVSLHPDQPVPVSGNQFSVTIPANCVFALDAASAGH